MITFGDNVRIIVSPETEERGIDGKTAQVYGETTPSITGVDVIGESKDDYTINVSIYESDEQLWIYPHLVDFLDHGEGTEIVVENIKAVRNADGSWEETEIAPVEKLCDEKKWWEFWK